MLYVHCGIDWKWVYLNSEKTKYEVSSSGRIRNSKTGRELSLRTLDKDGYVQIVLCHEGKHYPKHVHRVVAETFLPNPNNLPQVNHLDGCKSNNSIYNLEWCTSKENNLHAHKTGIHPGNKLGEEHFNSRYTNDQIKQVCELLSENSITIKEITKITKVKRSTIMDILHNNGWSHISSDYNIHNFNKYEREYISDDIKNRIKELLRNGKQNVEIMDELNFPHDDRYHALIKYYKDKL